MNAAAAIDAPAPPAPEREIDKERITPAGWWLIRARLAEREHMVGHLRAIVDAAERQCVAVTGQPLPPQFAVLVRAMADELASARHLREPAVRDLYSFMEAVAEDGRVHVVGLTDLELAVAYGQK